MDRVVAVRPPSSSTAVLFCPFCRESFEGETHCPEHELALVPFDRLEGATNSSTQPRDDERLDVCGSCARKCKGACVERGSGRAHVVHEEDALSAYFF